MVIIDLLNKKLMPITVRRLGENDHEELFRLHSGNTFYNSCLQKEQITRQQVLDGLSALPPNTAAEQKYYVGFFCDGYKVGEVFGGKLSDSTATDGGFLDSNALNCGCFDGGLVGCMDFVEGYPDAQTVFVGLFMLANGLHKQGFGGRIFGAFAKCAAESGFKKIRLACLMNNSVAYSFWTKHGFVERERKADSEGRAVIVLEKSL